MRWENNRAWRYRWWSVFLIMTSTHLNAQETWPTKPIKIIVPFQAGSAVDNAARVLAPKLTTILQQSIIIENRTGASGFIGTEAAARSANDGYTFLWGTTSTQVIGPSLNTNISYDPLKDFSSVGLIAFSPYILVTSTKLGYKDFLDFLNDAKVKPNKLTYASAGNSSMANLAAQLVSSSAQIQLVHIPYKSSAQSVTDTLNGTVSIQFSTFSPVIAHVKSGQLKALAVTSKNRLPLLPDVPTVSESGFPGFEAILWMGIFAPNGVSLDVIEKFSNALSACLKDPEILRQLQNQGLQISHMNPVNTDKFLRSELTKWSTVIKTRGIVAE